MHFFELTFVHLITEVDGGLGTQTHTHITQISVSHSSHMPQIHYIRAQIRPLLSHLSTLHISMFACCVWCHVLALLPMWRLSSAPLLPRAVAPVAVHGASYWPPKTKKRWTDRGGRGEGGGGGGFRTGQKEGKKEKPKRDKTKNIATGCWVTLVSVQVVTLLVAAVVVMVAGWTQTWGKPCSSHSGWAAMSETFPRNHLPRHLNGIAFMLTCCLSKNGVKRWTLTLFLSVRYRAGFRLWLAKLTLETGSREKQQTRALPTKTNSTHCNLSFIWSIHKKK